MITLSLKEEGMQGIKAAIKYFRKMGSVVSGVELKNEPRQGETATNSELLGYLFDDSRDFVTLKAAEKTRVMAAFNRALQISVARFSAMVKAGTGRGKTPESALRTAATRAITGALKAAITEYMDVVSEHIESQTGHGGLKPLDEEYLHWKIRNSLGDKIAIRSGQLLDNLNASGAGAGNIRFLKSK